MAVPHVILLESKFIWQQEEVETFRALHDRYNHEPINKCIALIAEEMQADPDDILLLFIDQAQKGKIGDGTN